MKNITLFALLLITTLASCKKDKAEKTTDRIEGKWKVEAVVFLEYQNGVEVNREQQSIPNQFCDFRPDGSASVNLDGESVEVKWTATESVIQLTTAEDYKVNLNIESLSKTNLTMAYDASVDVGNNVTTKETIEFQMRKVD